MPLKNVHYQKLETEESDGEEDESPPTHLPLQNSNHVKGKRRRVLYKTTPTRVLAYASLFSVLQTTLYCSHVLSSLPLGTRWNHIDNLDEFFERVSPDDSTEQQKPLT